MSLRTRTYLLFALAVTAGICAVVYWLRADMLPRYMEAQEDILADTAHVLATQIAATALVRREGDVTPSAALLADSLAPMHDRALQARISSLLKTDIGLRVYVTDRRGIVVFDSDNGRDYGEDYSEWRDVHRALQDEYGARTTQGDSLYPEGSAIYVAAPVYHQGAVVGAVGVGKSTRNAERFIVSAVERLVLTAAAVLVVALLLGAVLYHWLSQPLERLHSYAVALRSGRRQPPPKLGKDEVGRIGTAMTELRDALDGKQYIEQYVQSLAHELKSPTAAITGAAELLDADMPPADRERFIANIHSEAGRLEAIVRRVLELATLENQRGLQQSTPIALDALIADCIEAERPRAEARGVTLQRAGTESLIVEGDRFLLQQALSNLLANAVDFSPEGSAVTVSAQAEAGAVVVTVRDEGPGIPEYARERVFERFYSLPRADGRKSTGLGLAFVAEIADLHGGGVVLENLAEGGARAALRLPSG